MIAAAGLSMPAVEFVHAQQQPSAEDIPDAGWRNESIAGGLEVFFPLAGHGYAGDWKRGIKPAALRTIGMAGALYWYSTGCFDDVCEWVGVGGTLAFFSGWAWSVVSARRTSRDWNRSLRERLGVEPSLVIRPVRADRFEVVAGWRF
jgi:hypothetical protein